jgi:dTDP-4-amino-4,6-dideoxygalactose transaminase
MYVELRPEIDAGIERVADSGWYLRASELMAFEEAFAASHGVKHCVGLANGLDALHSHCARCKSGQVTKSLSRRTRISPRGLRHTDRGDRVPVEADARTFNIDPERIERAITPRTRAILPVHLYGQPADMQPIFDIAGRYGLRVLEDAVQSHGARY